MIIAIGCVVIAVAVGVVLGQPIAAVGGCIGWIAAMVWTIRRDAPSGGRS